MKISKIGFPLVNNPLNKVYNKKMMFKGQKDSFEKSISVKGSETEAKIYTENINQVAIDQIKEFCNHPAFKDAPIRIMPDVHAGKNSVVGFSAPIINGKVVPNVIGSDIGCGMLCCELDTNGEEIDYEALDNVIQKYISVSHTFVPTVRKENVKTIEQDLRTLCNETLGANPEKAIAGLGTLGGGNHFIEIDQSSDGRKFLVIHTGSRNLGQLVCNHHHNIALQQNPYLNPDLSFLTGDEAQKYLQDMKMAQKYAQVNRKIIADEIVKQMGWKVADSFESVHNYIDDKNITRKGAISAANGEKIIIPLNMRDGAIIALGKGNVDWNQTAPHGAGRKLTRTQAMETIQMEDYKKSMNGIYTTSICKNTLDECPQAYKDSDEIAFNITPTAEIVDKIRPKYNFKNKK